MVRLEEVSEATGFPLASSSRGISNGQESLQTLPFVFRDESSGKLVVHPSALEMLRSIDSPVAVVGLYGVETRGSLLCGLCSHFCKRSSTARRDFPAGISSPNLSTPPGLWLCPAAGTVTSTSAEHSVIFIGQDQGEQDQLLALVLLFSSVVVASSLGAVDPGFWAVGDSPLRLGREIVAACDLHKADAMTSPVNVQHVGSRYRGYRGQGPSLLWALRDYHQVKAIHESPDAWLAAALKHSAAGSGEANQVRMVFRKLFPDMKGFSLGAHGEGSSTYGREFAVLAQVVAEEVSPGEKGSRVLTGRLLATMIEAIIDSVNKGSLPKMSEAWEAAASKICREQCAASVEAYRKLMGNCIASPTKDLSAAHSDALEQVLERFSASTRFSEEESARYGSTLKRVLRGLHKTQSRKIADAKALARVAIATGLAFSGVLMTVANARPSTIIGVTLGVIGAMATISRI